MLQTNADALTVAEQAQESTQSVEPQVERDIEYAHADGNWHLENLEYPAPGFVNELLDVLGKDFHPEDARLVDQLEPTKDIDAGMLTVFPDESLMFLGKDPTAKDALPWYAFSIEPMEPTPTPTTARDALDLLKPPEVKDIVAEEGWVPDRHGEWWLLPTQLIPAGDIHKPGVKTEPYGPSPLGNHVPREYAFTVSNSEFLDAFHNNADAPNSIKSVPEALDWTFRQLQKKDPYLDHPTWADIRAWAGDVLVKGTIRHRDDDHFVENLGEQWHKAVTHRMEVYTADTFGANVHLDYYGQG